MDNPYKRTESFFYRKDLLVPVDCRISSCMNAKPRHANEIAFPRERISILKTLIDARQRNSINTFKNIRQPRLRNVMEYLWNSQDPFY